MYFEDHVTVLKDFIYQTGQLDGVTNKFLSICKITKFKSESCSDDLLEICYFHISQMKLSLDKIFYKVVYHHIIYLCDSSFLN
jgi:hypothetical protein